MLYNTHTVLLIYFSILETRCFLKVECVIIESQIFLFHMFVYVFFLFGNSLVCKGFEDRNNGWVIVMWPDVPLTLSSPRKP